MRLEKEFSGIKIFGMSLLVAMSACVSQSKDTAKLESDSGIAEVEKVSLPANEGAEDEISIEKITNNMVFFGKGAITFGSNQGRASEKPEFEKEIAAFWLDKSPVTVAQFSDFVKTTNYITVAEEFGNSFIFDFSQNKWLAIDGANWQYPFGPGKDKAANDHPVTHVAYDDAMAYARWIGKRLPSEFEWEYAAKNGKNTPNKYPWGDQVKVNGQYKANVWQGQLNAPLNSEDGFIYTSPVGYFGEHDSGLTDMAGNVWEWTSSYFEPYPGASEDNRAGPDVRVLRGGAFMFDQDGDISYSVWYRSKNTTETSLFNMGFRCAYSVD